ncbi:MAG TPA: type VI secretion system baseplate subunit TssE [Rhodopila sp.]|nr:type VI secretion system baseplate subunit TssE [Rhodopila sp.]
MASRVAKDRLQPSLFDRLNDELAGALVQFAQDRRALEGMLTDAQRQALTELLADERLERRLASGATMAVLAALPEDGRVLLDRVVSAEIARRQQVRRSVVMTTQELRAAVLRDLQNLLNTTAAEADLREDERTLDGFPLVQAGVLNYGVPALAGRIRTTDDVVELARDIERAIERYEPRIRYVRVSVADAGAVSSPLELIIEGELWGYPIAEQLRVHTVLDLDAGHAEVTGTERVA